VECQASYVMTRTLLSMLLVRSLFLILLHSRVAVFATAPFSSTATGRGNSYSLY